MKFIRYFSAKKKVKRTNIHVGEYLDSTYVIDFDRLYEEGYRGIIFDIDNTLVPHGAPADERACALFAHLKELGFQCMLLSNNKEPRVKMFNDAVHVSYIYKAGNRAITAGQCRRWERMPRIPFSSAIRFLRMFTEPILPESEPFW